MEEMTILDEFMYSEDPLQECAGSPVIMQPTWDKLAEELSSGEYSEVTKTKEEIIDVFIEQSKRFSACGANLGDSYAVLRKNPKSGWNYLKDLITEK